MAERGEESTWKLWVLINAPRSVIALIGIVGMFVGLVLLMAFGPSTIEKILAADEVATLFSAIVGAIITSVTLILTVTQLVISQEIGSLSEQNERLEDQSDFRNRVEEGIGLDVSPSEPALFFRALVESTVDRGNTVLDEVDCRSSSDLSEVADYAAGLVDHAEGIRDDLRGAEFGSFTVLSSVLDYNYSQKIHEARRLRNTHRGELDEDVDAALEDLIETLRYFGPTRGFFKTLYFQWELIEVSRAMVYSALPVLTLAAYMILAFEPGDIVGSILGIPSLYVLTSGAYAATLVPFVLLLAYVIRILSVLKRTLAPGSFVLRSTDRTEEIQWSDP